MISGKTELMQAALSRTWRVRPVESVLSLGVWAAFCVEREKQDRGSGSHNSGPRRRMRRLTALVSSTLSGTGISIFTPADQYTNK